MWWWWWWCIMWCFIWLWCIFLGMQRLFMRPLGHVFVFPPLAGCVAVCADASIENVAAAIVRPTTATSAWRAFFIGFSFLGWIGFSFLGWIVFYPTETNEWKFGSMLCPTCNFCHGRDCRAMFNIFNVTYHSHKKADAFNCRKASALFHFGSVIATNRPNLRDDLSSE